MVDINNTEELQELLAGYVLGDLTSEEVQEVNHLLQSNPDLVEEVRQLQETLALLPLALPEKLPPDNLGSKILSNATASLSVPPSPEIIKNKNPLGLITLASLATFLVLGLGIYNYNLQQKITEIEKKLSEYQEAIAILRLPSNRLLSLEATKSNSKASGSLLINPNSKTGILTIQNLDTLPTGKIYRLWAVTKEEKIYCSEFLPDQTGKVFVQFPLDTLTPVASTVIITIEDAENISPPSGETVMTGSVSL